VVDSLVELRLIQDHEKTVALQKLGSHDGAVEVVGNLLTQINNMKVAEARQAALNQGSPDAGTAKTASGRAAEKPVVVGSKPGLGEKRGSDLAFLRGLGIPTE
jgi:3-deoxy-D-manno-octulosonic-acid transferase